MPRIYKIALALAAFAALLALMMLAEPGPTECDDSNLPCEEATAP